MMDTQEYSSFTYTKSINPKSKFGCSLCNDLTKDLMNPERVSFQYPRSPQQLIHNAEQKQFDSDDSSEEHENEEDDHPEEIKTDIDMDLDQYDLDNIPKMEWSQWKSDKYGFIKTEVDKLKLKYHCNASYAITTDIHHFSKNLAQQLVVSVFALEDKLNSCKMNALSDMINIS